MKVAVIDHHEKTLLIQAILHEEGLLTNNLDEADIVLADTDHPYAPKMPLNGGFAPLRFKVLEYLAHHGKKIALYPHGGSPQLDYDGLVPASDWIAVQFVHGEGHQMAHDIIGFPRRIEVVGWSFTPWKQTHGEHHLLFAPIHPWANGRDILKIHRQANEQAYELFLSIDADRKTVRQYGEDSPNGVRGRVPGVDYQQSDFRIPLDLIDSASRVIASGTVAYTALARGKLVDMIDKDLPLMDDMGTKTIDHWEEIKPFYKYDGGSPEWVQRWVGGPFQRGKFLEVLESL